MGLYEPPWTGLKCALCVSSSFHSFPRLIIEPRAKGRLSHPLLLISLKRRPLAHCKKRRQSTKLLIRCMAVGIPSHSRLLNDLCSSAASSTVSFKFPRLVGFKVSLPRWLRRLAASFITWLSTLVFRKKLKDRSYRRHKLLPEFSARTTMALCRNDLSRSVMLQTTRTTGRSTLRHGGRLL